MAKFELSQELSFNREKIGDPERYARERGCSSWLYLCGEEFAGMEGGMSYSQVEAAVPHSARVVTDPPRTLDLDLARQHVAALDELPRPTLVSCRSGPRASAVAYMYSGLRQGAEPEEVLAAAERDGAPFVEHDYQREWVVRSIEALRAEQAEE